MTVLARPVGAGDRRDAVDNPVSLVLNAITAVQAAASANAPRPRDLGITPGNPVAKRIRIVQDDGGPSPQT